ncbi:hypothetical protein WJX75_006719 [Coccomyxa subellipsoidea]|uniref:Amino acid transporter n=1 Tax=Coccomyxa subellipsoidea TaxID=248742 RepID=A0ABR2YPV5_9CHLO
MRDDVESHAAVDSGQLRLEALAYKQQLRRTMSFTSSFCASLTLMSGIMGVTASVGYTYRDGGPMAAVWGWMAVSLTNILMAVALAELVSAYPVAGGSYVWCLELTDNKPDWMFLAWVTGWLNIVGQFAMTAVNSYFTAKLITIVWLLAGGRHSTNFDVFLIYSICLLIAGVASCLSTDGLRMFSVFSGAFFAAAGALIIAILPMLAPTLQPANSVFFGSAVNSASEGVPISTYMLLMALPKANFAYVTPQTPTLLAEETRRADVIAPYAIIWSVFTSAVLGMGFLLVVLFCIQDPSTVLSGRANGYLVAQVLYDVFQGRFGKPVGGLICLGLLLIIAVNAIVMSMAANARALWAFSRDGGLPLHRVWAAVNGRTGTPVNAVWAMTAAAFLLGLPILAFPDNLACNAVGIACVGLDISYGIPMFLRIWQPRKFEPGPLNLGRFQPYLNVLALTFMAVIAGAFLMPLHIPINGDTLNWTFLGVGLTAALAYILWHWPKPGAAADYRGSARLRDRRLLRTCTCGGVPSAAAAELAPRPMTLRPPMTRSQPPVLPVARSSSGRT